MNISKCLVVLVVEEPAEPNPALAEPPEAPPLPVFPEDDSPDNCEVRLAICDALSDEDPDSCDAKLDIWEAFRDDSPDNCEVRLEICDAFNDESPDNFDERLDI